MYGYRSRRKSALDTNHADQIKQLEQLSLVDPNRAAHLNTCTGPTTMASLHQVLNSSSGDPCVDTLSTQSQEKVDLTAAVSSSLGTAVKSSATSSMVEDSSSSIVEDTITSSMVEDRGSSSMVEDAIKDAIDSFDISALHNFDKD